MAILKFLMSGQHRKMEIGRQRNIPKDEQKGAHCDTLEDEYQALFDCPLYLLYRVSEMKLYALDKLTVTKEYTNSFFGR